MKSRKVEKCVRIVEKCFGQSKTRKVIRKVIRKVEKVFHYNSLYFIVCSSPGCLMDRSPGGPKGPLRSFIVVVPFHSSCHRLASLVIVLFVFSWLASLITSCICGPSIGCGGDPWIQILDNSKSRTVENSKSNAEIRKFEKSVRKFEKCFGQSKTRLFDFSNFRITFRLFDFGEDSPA